MFSSNESPNDKFGHRTLTRARIASKYSKKPIVLRIENENSARIHRTNSPGFTSRSAIFQRNTYRNYLVALCNVDGLKTKFTNFNRDIEYLETVGISSDGGLNIGGTLVQLLFDNLGANQAMGLLQRCTHNIFHCTSKILKRKICKQHATQVI